MAHLGRNIAKLRGFRRIPQKDMAARLDMKQQTYSDLEQKAQIDDDLLERIAEILEFPVDAIKELENGSVFNINQQGGNAGNTFYQYNPNEKIIELYERMLKEKDELLKQKDDIIAMYKQKAS